MDVLNYSITAWSTRTWRGISYFVQWDLSKPWISPLGSLDSTTLESDRATSTLQEPLATMLRQQLKNPQTTGAERAVNASTTEDYQVQAANRQEGTELGTAPRHPGLGSSAVIHSSLQLLGYHWTPPRSAKAASGPSHHLAPQHCLWIFFFPFWKLLTSHLHITELKYSSSPKGSWSGYDCSGVPEKPRFDAAQK